MRLKLERPLVILDVETTGLHPQVDRIVQIGLVKLYPDGRRTEWSSLIYPGIPIPPELFEVHGITDESVREAPAFSLIAPTLASGLMGCDLGGYNVFFDIKFLKAEFDRVGARGILDGAKVVDMFRIFIQKCPRNLSAAFEYYTGQKLEGAHDALVDAKAAMTILDCQLAVHEDLPDEVPMLHKIFFESVAQGHLDPDGKLAWRHNEATINFGKWATVPLKEVPSSYLHWMMRGEFSDAVKRVIQEALNGNFPRR